MKKIILLLASVFIIFLTCRATDEKEVLTIREQYQKIQADIKNGNLVCNELSINKNDYQMCTVGTRMRTCKFYYRYEDTICGEKESYFLLKVEISSRISAHHFYKEFVYNEQGDIIFVYHQQILNLEGEDSNTNPYDCRYYFSQHKLIKKINTRSDEIPTAEILKEAQFYQDLFHQIMPILINDRLD